MPDMNTTFSPFEEKIIASLDAGFAGIWVRTQEISEVLVSIERIARVDGHLLATWNPINGFVMVQPSTPTGAKAAPDTIDPRVALAQLCGKDMEPPDAGNTVSRSVLVMQNFQTLLQPSQESRCAPMVLQALQNALLYDRAARRHVIIVSYEGFRVPHEIEALVRVIDHDLPTAEELHTIATELVKGYNDDVEREQGDEGQLLPAVPPLDTDDGKAIINAALGLTRGGAESAFSLSLQQHQQLDIRELWQMKVEMLRKTSGLEVHQSDAGFSTIGGLEAVKKFMLNSIHGGQAGSIVQPKGVLLLGPSGVGKSQLAKAVGNETKRPTISLNIGALMGSLVGQTEERTRIALRQVDAIGPCVLFVD